MLMAVALDRVSVPSDYAEMARRLLDAEQCALVVVDIQDKLLPPIFQKDQLLRNSKLLIRAARILKIPALVSTQYAISVTVPPSPFAYCAGQHAVCEGTGRYGNGDRCLAA